MGMGNVQEMAMEEEPENGKLRMIYDENNKTIDDLLSSVMDHEGNIDPSEPSRIMDTYRQIEEAVLTQGKGRLGTLYTKAMIKVGADSLPKAIDKEKKLLDKIVNQYRDQEKGIQSERRQIASQKVALKCELDQVYHLGDTLQEQVEITTQLIAEKELRIAKLMNASGFGKEKRDELSKLRNEIEGLRIQSDDYKAKEAEAALKVQTIDLGLANIQRQDQQWTKTLYAVQKQKYDQMQKQTPTISLLKGVKYARQISELYRLVNNNSGNLEQLNSAAFKIQEMIDKSTTMMLSTRESAPEKPLEYSPVNDHKDRIVDTFREKRRLRRQQYAEMLN